jgi:hypothetical protein
VVVRTILVSSVISCLLFIEMSGNKMKKPPFRGLALLKFLFITTYYQACQSPPVSAPDNNSRNSSRMKPVSSIISCLLFPEISGKIKKPPLGGLFLLDLPLIVKYF